MKKIFSTLLMTLLFGAQQVQAQQQLTDSTENMPNARHHFEVNLPEQISFKVALVALDDWSDNDFLNIFNNQVKKHIDYFTDSIHSNPTLQNLLYIERKPAAGFEKMNFRQLSPKQSEIVFKEGSYYHLKNSIDSLCYTYYVVNAHAAKGANDSLHQNQITISAKSLPDINTLSSTQIFRVHQQLDSMVQAAKLKVNRYRNPLYSSNSSWSLSAKGTQTSSYNGKKPFTQVMNNFKLGVGFGAIVFNNTISPNLELSLGYMFKRNAGTVPFIGFNYSLFTEIDLRDRSNMISYLPLNFEFGTIRNNVGLMQRKTSIAYGVLIKNERESGSKHYLFNMQLNFALSNTVSSSLILASQLKKDPEHYVFGVSLKYNL